MYTLYILLCADGTLYTGIAKDLASRLKVHESGKGSKYVNARLPFKLIYQESHANRSLASKRESEIKSWDRRKKISELELSI